MGAAQMYYTSCEVGLAGYPGFQFNGATPGTDPAVLRRVEQGTSYEPPRSLGYQPTAEQIAACPVNLCYLPGTTGEPAVLASTVFVGTDYSNRFGNYFVHALSLPSVEDDLGGALPIDFWRAGFWARTETPHAELPEIDPVPPAGAGPAATEKFLLGSGRRGWLPRLLTAVERAMVARERSVVVVEADSERVASWIAAVCHLLPPAMSRQLSFATYSFRPGRNSEHLIGTVPETDFVADETALRGYFLFDVVGGQASEVGVHPLAELLTAQDVQDAAGLWALAEPLGDGTERDFDGWYPLAAAGALRAGIPVGADDLAAVVDWLSAHAPRLRPALASEVAHRCLAHDALTARLGAALVGVAAVIGDEVLLAAAEIRTFEVLLEEPARALPEVPRPTTAEGIEHATDLITAKLNAPGDVPALLTVAVRAGLRLDPRDLENWGRDQITAILLRGEEDGRIPGLVRHLPDLRGAVLEALAAALPRHGSAVLAATARLGGAVPEQEIESYPELHRALLLARAAGDPGRRVRTLLHLFPDDPPDQAVLATLWPGEWSVAEAAEVADAVPEKFWNSPALLGRLDDVLRRPEGPRAGSTWTQYEDLCRLAAKRRLSPAATGHVEQMLRVRRLIDQRKAAKGSRLREILLELLELFRKTGGPPHRYLESCLPQMLLRLDAGALTDVLPAVPEPVRHAYWQQVTATLQGRPADLAVAGALLDVRAQLTRQPVNGELDRVLAETVAHWRSRDLDALEKWLGGSAAHFQKWRDENVRGGLGRFLPRRKH